MPYAIQVIIFSPFGTVVVTRLRDPELSSYCQLAKTYLYLLFFTSFYFAITLIIKRRCICNGSRLAIFSSYFFNARVSNGEPKGGYWLLRVEVADVSS